MGIEERASKKQGRELETILHTHSSRAWGYGGSSLLSDAESQTATLLNEEEAEQGRESFCSELEMNYSG